MSSVPPTSPPGAIVPECSVVRPSSTAEFECVDPMQRYLICDVSAWFENEAQGVFGRVYGPTETVHMGPNPDPLCNGNFQIVPSTPPRKIWRNQRLTLSPPSVVPTACTNNSPYPQLTVKVWAYRYGTFANATQTFSSKCCTPSFTTTVPTTLPAYPAVAPTPTSTPTFLAVPTQFRYRNLSVNNMFVGNQLMLSADTPLRAATIQVVARRVRWRTGSTRIRHCLGNLLLAGEGWRFPDAFEYSIVIFQPSVGYQMVLSQDRNRFQTMHLDPNSDIHVLVNDLWAGGFDDNEGHFDLVIRVVA